MFGPLGPQNSPPHRLAAPLGDLRMVHACEKRFPTRHALAAHMRSKHKNGEFTCPKCGWKCKTYAASIRSRASIASSQAPPRLAPQDLAAEPVVRKGGVRAALPAAPWASEIALLVFAAHVMISSKRVASWEALLARAPHHWAGERGCMRSEAEAEAPPWRWRRARWKRRKPILVFALSLSISFLLVKSTRLSTRTAPDSFVALCVSLFFFLSL